MPVNHTADANNASLNASLIFICPAQPKVVASLANFFVEHEVDIANFREFSADECLFVRLEWALGEQWQDEAAFALAFKAFAESHSAFFNVRFLNRKLSVGLFVGSDSRSLVEFINHYYIHGGNSALTIPFVMGRDNAVRSVVDRYGLPFFHVGIDSSCPDSVRDHEFKQLEIINRYKPDYLAMANYDGVISSEFINAINCPMISVRRMFMPEFSGENAFEQAHRRGVKLVGATAYFASGESMCGPILEQDTVSLNGDISLSGLIEKSHELEQQVFVNAMMSVLEHKVVTYNKRTVSFN